MVSLIRPLTLSLVILACRALHAAELSDTLSTLPRTAPGTELGTIKVGSRVYHEVRIKSYDSRSLVFTHSGGLGSARLGDLTPDLQDLLGYDPSRTSASAVEKSSAAKSSRAPALTPLPQPIETTEASVVDAPAEFDALVTAFGSKPDFRTSQSLKGEFIRLSLTAKSQGRRMSCAIFAIVSALEYQNARANGTPQKLSETYLVWATRRINGHAQSGPTGSGKSSPSLPADSSDEDLGYSLSEVISGLRAYGIAAEEEISASEPGGTTGLFSPDEALIASARNRRMVNILPVPGRQNPTVLANIVQALNHGYPVPVGLRWPFERSIHAGFLKDQPPRPNAFHAVTLVGYECPGGRAEDTVFTFKNSFGVEWGTEGYGRATWGYLEQNLTDAIVLDVAPTTKTR